MRKVSFLVFAALLFALSNIQSQTLINTLDINSLNIQIDGNTLSNDGADGRMLIPHNKTKIKLYQDQNLAYWAEFKYKECGKMAKLKSKTYVELKDGKVLNGSKNHLKRSLEENQPGWFVAFTNDTISISNNSTFIAGFDYEMRISN
jgi:hypothetical protein